MYFALKLLYKRGIIILIFIEINIMGEIMTTDEINEFEKIICKSNSLFLCGNGFSINFDSDFSNIYERLFEAHKYFLNNHIYEVNGNKNFNTKTLQNFKVIKEKLKRLDKDKFEKIFTDAIIFANSVLDNEELIEELFEQGLFSNLTFGFSQLDVLKEMSYVEKTKGINSINIENWTLLIYIYFAIKKLKTNKYKFPESNLFLFLVQVGNKSSIKISKEELYENFILNGFVQYYRFLFLTAIFSNGKAIELSSLNRINNLDLETINIFLDKFSSIVSLNYDSIIELISQKKINHLHGEFLVENADYTYYQRLSIKWNQKKINISNILLGDYFFQKTIIPVLNSFTGNDNLLSKKLENEMKNKKINCILIFGMNIENDYHILRNLMVNLFLNKAKNPKIIYCYFNEEEKIQFKKQYEKVITFNKEASEYAGNIELNFIKTQDVLEKYFKKQ